MKPNTITIIKNLRYTKLSGAYAYYYLCLDEEFMKLKDATDDLQHINTLRSSSATINKQIIIEYLMSINVNIHDYEDNIILFSVKNDDNR